ncbi:BCCT family transporter [Pelistega europaea]|uniref:BCCT family transporter n=1 Tax=Pelistega europaea TaxID=106147 RepID=A0A7Y4LAC8_9BURK|nr:BCCT family transporter [Pelistega europaea]NOL49862.1 BCCT family transporter [Pelistega europaea]
MKTTFNMKVFVPSFIVMIIIGALGMLVPEKMKATLDIAQKFAFNNFSWLYVLAASLFLGFLLALIFSRLGDIRLGADDEDPEYPFFSWVAMLFAAGMGVGLMYFGVAEPMMHYASPITEDNVAKNAMLYTFFHWGVHPWAIYGVMALALAFFGYRYRLPLSLRSTFYPLLKDRINGTAGNIIDAFGLLATVFGIVTTLGFSAIQLNSGLNDIGWLQEVGFSQQAIIIIVVTSIAILSAISGVGKGVRRLSELNLLLALALMVFILLCGPTVKLLASFAENAGYYLSNLTEISFRTFAYDDAHQGWFTGWTILYWAWWASWAPFVGLFIARISRGRTVREFVMGVLIVPTVFSLLWFTIFGNSGIWVNEMTGGALANLTSKPEVLLFEFLDYFPMSTVSSFVAMTILALFFVTSADSGIIVLNNIASGGSNKPVPRWQSILWGVVLIVMAIALLRTDGLGAVQAVTLVVALPFVIIMVGMCVSLMRGLRSDAVYFSRKLNAGSVFWSGARWKQRLHQIMHQTQEDDVKNFFAEVVSPAFETLRQELVDKYQLQVNVRQIEEPELAMEFVVEKGQWRNFLYGIKVQTSHAHASLAEEETLPGLTKTVVHEPFTYFGDGRVGYDVQYMTKDELIADILKQYQRYLNLMHNEDLALIMKAPLEE